MYDPLLWQHPGLRQFLLTNLVEVEGRHVWRVNLEAISNHLADIMNFPVFHKPYLGPVLFLGGSKSSYIRWDWRKVVQACGLTSCALLQLLRVGRIPQGGRGHGASFVIPAASDTNTVESKGEAGGQLQAYPAGK